MVDEEKFDQEYIEILDKSTEKLRKKYRDTLTEEELEKIPRTFS